MTMQMVATCNQCGVAKQKSNRWFIGLRLHERAGPRFQTQRLCGFKILAWTNKRAIADDAEHLCGPRCAQIWASKVMEKLSAAHEAAPEPAVTGASEHVIE